MLLLSLFKRDAEFLGLYTVTIFKTVAFNFNVKVYMDNLETVTVNGLDFHPSGTPLEIHPRRQKGLALAAD